MAPATSITPNSAAVVPVRFSAVDINDTSQMVKHILWSTIQTREHLGMHVHCSFHAQCMPWTYPTCMKRCTVALRVNGDYGVIGSTKYLTDLSLMDMRWNISVWEVRLDWQVDWENVMDWDKTSTEWIYNERSCDLAGHYMVHADLSM